MAGQKILFRLVDVGFVEPTTVYDVTENAKGDLEIHKVLDHRNVPLAVLCDWLNDQEVRRPVVLTDPHPMVLQELKSKGIRVR